MLKKLLTSTAPLMLMLFLVSGSVFASPVTSSTTEDQQKALRIIERANNEIEAKIEHAVAAADRLQQNYLQDIQAIEEGQAANQLSAKLDDLSAKLDKEKNASKKAQIAAEAAVVQSKLDEENASIAADITEIKAASDEVVAQMFSAQGSNSSQVQASVNELNQTASTLDALIAERTKQYTTDLDKLITDLYNETLQIADEAIAQAADLGVFADHFWKLVKIADREVWIDPLVVGL
ncbi:hypothetical protein KIH86_28835 [Paenibacillus sp. HN-1]|uniref:hypothetical protein n=1 Tax=Paenibacillus TaxID=44249 RepID=UPI001CA8671B|nr:MULTISPECIES: hypothetical protein [Paenibacillus]MBY9077844.1 hypothetical protein [Paenibacillus sp. CGMCC 1.18879]MBY9088200.1 hypothetical protein [Paenibacillus sinensis]